MLIGYNKNGIIEFIFTDDSYLAKKYPNNSVKVTDFWGPSGSHLKELFIEVPEDFNYKMHKVVDGKLVKLDKPLPKEKPVKIVIEEKSSGPVNIEVKGDKESKNKGVSDKLNLYGVSDEPNLYGGQI